MLRRIILPALALLGLALSLAGCTSIFHANVSSFQQLPPGLQGKTIIVVAPADQQDSMEFIAYRPVLEARLAKQGFVVTRDADMADLIAGVLYGIDDGKTSSYSYMAPIYGTISGGGTADYSGTVNTPNGPVPYRGTVDVPEQRGVIGYEPRTVTETTYLRHLQLMILDAHDLSRHDALYLGKVVSTGRCSSLPAVFDKLVEALFEDWPGTNNAVRQVRLSAGDIECGGLTGAL
ncbi:DUF4136 domain-containing protein [Dongia soli]|uniref:DUF4136 domain-containing protein n=1 Tax=Dongia soli TaxID=600628 RepID=A0ABU5EEG1_9PROT|nr:DUF4136 domain-containing protein [Dongia soli]MDY0884562.1 DUF4136 domain-containing protein [Dongia soli]